MIEWVAPRRRPLPRQPITLLALAWLLLVVAVAALAPLLPVADPQAIDSLHALQPPGIAHVLGTDFLGRDILARLLWGGRWTLQMGGLALSLAIGIGLPLGLAAGSGGGRVDALLMRLVDAWLAFPPLLLAMAVVAILGTGLVSVAVAVGIAAVPPYARVARSIAREVRAQPYIEAAWSIGCSPWRIAVRHVFPNALPSLVAFTATQLGWLLLNGAALNFLGLGAPLGVPEWGSMLAEGRGYLRAAPWASGFPGLALTLTVLAANLVGDGLQEALG
ncbi:MAG: ABC transporter permease [Anaerolineae bacterium]|nr:ABC transporter permease [Anaerolineae bacterium]